MITTDKVKVDVGDNVWDIFDNAIDEGVIVRSYDSSVVIKWEGMGWPEEYGYWDNTEEIEEEVYGNKQNATNALIERLEVQINNLQETVNGLRNG